MVLVFPVVLRVGNWRRMGGLLMAIVMLGAGAGPVLADRDQGDAQGTPPGPVDASAARAAVQDAATLLGLQRHADTSMARAGLATADAILATMHGRAIDDRSLVVDVAQLAARRRAADLDLGWDEAGYQRDHAVHHATASDAALALLARSGHPVDDDDIAAMRGLDDLAPALSAAVRDAIDAYIGFASATEAAYAGLDPSLVGQDVEAMSGRVAPGEAFRAWGVDPSLIGPAREALLRAAWALQQIADDGLPSTQLVLDFCPTFAFDLGSSNVHPPCDFIIDMFGSDLYQGNAGGNRLCDLTGAGAVIDTDGHDRYGDPNVYSDCGKNGGAVRGTGFLFDGLGTDLYQDLQCDYDYYCYDAYSLGCGSNGGGCLAGIGFLIDLEGFDFYFGGYSGTNGGGSSGIGMLIDGVGWDAYHGVAWCDYFDGYWCSRADPAFFGINGGAVHPGGAGALVDLEGLDYRWSGGVGVNGGGEDLAVGFLFDSIGSDSYQVEDYSGWNYERQYGFGANGGGNALGTGTLVDVSVDLEAVIGSTEQNLFLAGTHGVNGGSAGAGVGVLVTSGSDDHYYSVTERAADCNLPDLRSCSWWNPGHTGVNGGARWSFAGGTGLVYDVGGDDEYYDVEVDCVDCSRLPKDDMGAMIDSQPFNEGGYSIVGPIPTSPPVPSGDGDGDLLPERVGYSGLSCTVEDDGDITCFDSGPDSAPVDPDDGDPSDPIPAVTDGPYAQVVPDCGSLDRVCYKLGAQVTYKGQVLVDVVDGSADAGLLPLALPPTPTGDIGAGPDADGDGVPADFRVFMEQCTIREDGDLVCDPMMPVIIPGDLDEGDPSDRIPMVTDGPYADVVFPCDALDRVCYKVGAEVTHQGSVVVPVQEGTVDAGLLPRTLPPTPTGDIGAGPDADGDGVPADFRVFMEQCTIREDGDLVCDPMMPVIIPGDLDEGDLSDRIPMVTDGPYADVVFPCDALDRVCYKVGAEVTHQGRVVVPVQEGTVDAGLLPRTLPPTPTGVVVMGPDADGDGLPAYAQFGMQECTLQAEGTFDCVEAAPLMVPIDDDERPVVPEDVTVLTPPASVDGPLQDIEVGPGEVRYQCGASILFDLPGVRLDGLVDFGFDPQPVAVPAGPCR